MTLGDVNNQSSIRGSCLLVDCERSTTWSDFWHMNTKPLKHAVFTMDLQSLPSGGSTFFTTRLPKIPKTLTFNFPNQLLKLLAKLRDPQSNLLKHFPKEPFLLLDYNQSKLKFYLNLSSINNWTAFMLDLIDKIFPLSIEMSCFTNKLCTPILEKE